MIQAEMLYDRVLEKIDLSRDMNDEELRELIHLILQEQEAETVLSLKEKIYLSKELYNAFRKLNILQELLEDDQITEIMINGMDNIFIEKDGKMFPSDRRFISKIKLEDVIQQIVSESNRVVNESSPIVDARLSDGSRVNIVLPYTALNGPAVTIRKFPKDVITMEKLLEWNSISEKVAAFLERLVKAKYNIFISGGTGSGKTTFLNVLSNYIPTDERIITIEDNAELQIKGIPNLVRMEARNANVEGKGEITIRQLIRTALRMRPDRIIVGEVRSGEALDMLQAMNTGHDGSLSTGHSNNPRDMLSRLETMALMGMDLPLSAIQRQIAAGVDIIVHLGRMKDKSRKVMEITEVLDYYKGEIRMQTLYEFELKEIKNEKIKGEWKKRNEIINKEKLLASGY